MPSSSRPDRLGALRTLLTIIAVAGAGLLLLLMILVATGAHLFEPARQAIPAAMAGLAVGQSAPAIIAEGWVNGEPDELDGRVTVVQAWFYECRYCWQEAPEIASLHEKYVDRVSFVALSPDPVETRPQVEDFVARNRIGYPVGYGAAESLVLGFDVQAFPSVWVVGRDGKVVWNRSLEDKQSLEEAIVAALGSSTAEG